MKNPVKRNSVPRERKETRERQWSKFPEDNRILLEGDIDEIEDVLHEHYGMSKDEARRALQALSEAR